MKPRKKAKRPYTRQPESVRDKTLAAAKEAVTSRDTNYGKPEDNFLRIARLWNAHLKNIGIIQEGDRLISNADVALMLVYVKGGRLANTITHDDSWTDVAGYAACGAEASKNIASD